MAALNEFIQGLARVSALVERIIKMSAFEAQTKRDTMNGSAMYVNGNVHDKLRNFFEEADTISDVEVARLQDEIKMLEKKIKSERSQNTKLKNRHKQTQQEIQSTMDQIAIQRNVIDRLKKQYISSFSVVEESSPSTSFAQDCDSNRNMPSLILHSEQLTVPSSQSLCSSVQVESSHHFSPLVEVSVVDDDCYPAFIPLDTANHDFCIYTFDPFGMNSEETEHIPVTKQVPHRPPWSAWNDLPIKRKKCVVKKTQKSLTNKRKRSDCFDDETKANRRPCREERQTRSGKDFTFMETSLMESHCM